MIQSDLDRSHNSKSRANPSNNDIGSKLMQKPVASDQRHVLKKSLSQKDFRSYDGYSVSVNFVVKLIFVCLTVEPCSSNF